MFDLMENVFGKNIWTIRKTLLGVEEICYVLFNGIVKKGKQIFWQIFSSKIKKQLVSRETVSLRDASQVLAIKD